MAHAVLGAVTAQLNNQPALAGGLGASGAELAARVIADKLFNADTPAKRAQRAKRQQVSTLSQLAAGVAGGLATGDTAGAVTGGQAGKNAVYNNYLSSTEARQLDKEMQECKSSGGDCNKVVEKYIDISNKTVRSWLKPVPVAVLLVWPGRS